MESSQAHRVDVSDLDFSVRTEPLQVIGNSRIFQTHKYLGVYSDNALLGIKPQQELAQWIPNHYQTYQLAQALFEELFGRGSARVCFLTEDRSWMASLIGEVQYKTGFINQEDHSERLLFTSDSSLLGDLKSGGFKPSIGVVNGFDYNDTTAFYLLVEPFETDLGNLPVLTLASFKFSDRQQHDLALLPEHNQNHHALHMLKAALDRFKKQLDRFLSLYKKLRRWPSDQEHLSAISLDLYNKNRNVASVAMDGLLAAELRKFVSAADKYYQGQDHMSAVIDFIMRYNEFYLGNAHYFRTKIEQLFVRKKSYQKVERIFGKSDSSSPNFDKYINEQVRSYHETVSVLCKATP